MYGSEITRGFDTFGLLPSQLVSENEIDAAGEARFDEFDAQHQERIVWEPSFNVAGAYYDQAIRDGTLSRHVAKFVGNQLDKAERAADRDQRLVAVVRLTLAIAVLDRSPLRTSLVDLRRSLLH